MRAWKGPILLVVLAMVFGVLGGIALAEDTPSELTACLGDNGQLKDVAIGDEPLKDCENNETQVSWGGLGEGCFGTYYVDIEAIDSQSGEMFPMAALWTFGPGGTFVATDTGDDVPFGEVEGLSLEQGSWEWLGTGQAKLVALDFDLEGEASPSIVGRYDMSLSFADDCSVLNVTDRVIHLFDVRDDGVDPLDPSTASESFTSTSAISGRALQVSPDLP